jgi:hypothetical protein
VKATWPSPVIRDDGPERADQLHVELDADEEQQHRDAEFGQETDLLVRPHDVERRGTGEQADGDEAHDQRLPQDDAEKPDGRGHDEKDRDLGERGVEDGVHQARPSRRSRTRRRLPVRAAVSRKSSRSLSAMRQPLPMSIARRSPSRIHWPHRRLVHLQAVGDVLDGLVGVARHQDLPALSVS